MNSKKKFWICETCDLIVEYNDVKVGVKYHCPRCHNVIYHCKANVMTNLLLISFSALLIFYPAFFYPVMKLSVAGLTSTGNVYSSYLGFYNQGENLLSIIVFITVVLIPFLIPFFIFVVTLFNKLRIYPSIQREFLKLFIYLKDWGMVEVYLLGIFVSIIKMYSLAEINFDIGFYIYIFFTFLNIMIFTYFNKQTIWDEMENQLPIFEGDNVDDNIELRNTGKESNLILCDVCHKIIPAKDSENTVCPRCLSKAYYRKPNSLNNALSLLIVSMIFIIPANVLPIMKVKFLGSDSFSTIMDGIIYFFQVKEYGIGAIIFIASVLVPLYKILVILILIIDIKFKRQIDLLVKTKLFESIEFIGKWSMLDIFVIALMVLFVSFGELSATYASDAAIYFAIVVFSTMLSGHFLDIRLLWDNKN